MKNPNKNVYKYMLFMDFIKKHFNKPKIVQFYLNLSYPLP